MAFDATVSGASANSLVSVTRADELLLLRVGASSWAALDNDIKESALVTATNRILSLCYVGTKATAAQALLFPMSGLTRGGFAVDNTTIPYEIEIAIVEDAFGLTQDASTLLETTTSIQGITKIKAGPIEIGFDSNIKFKPIPDNVKALIPSNWLCENDVSEATIEVF